MRPKSVAVFEGLYLLAILIEIARIVQHWALLAASPAPERWSRIAAVAISLLLVLLASRWRKRLAALLLAALFVIGLPVAFGPFIAGGAILPLLPLALQILLQAGALAMLLRPDSRAWFAGATGTRA